MEAIIGGYMYRGTKQPKLYGTYFFADWVTGDVWAAKRTASGWWATRLLHTTHAWSSLGQDRYGQTFYLCDIASGGIYRIAQK